MCCIHTVLMKYHDKYKWKRLLQPGAHAVEDGSSGSQETTKVECLFRVVHFLGNSKYDVEKNAY